jgi:RNA polymerase sigma-70 factor (ECF subfamily)
VECFKQGDALERAERGRAVGFRPFLFGIARNVALRLERKRGRPREQSPVDDLCLEAVADDDPGAWRAFERAWATALVREAAQLQEQQAQRKGLEAYRRVELLHLRFYESLPIREIAHRWKADAAALHHEYAKARREFKAALLQVVAFHHPGSPIDVEGEGANLLATLG